MAVDKSFRNVVHLGFAFMLIFTAFQTMGNIQKTILDSVHQEDNSFNGDGYVSLAIIYAVMSICNWLAPSAINMTGPRFAMFYGGLTYLFFIMTFLIPKEWLLYFASSVIGTGAALIWTGQGNYLTLNSSKATMSRNSGVFWAMLQFSMFVGNLFVFIKFKGQDKIDEASRTVVIWTLSGISVAGLVVVALLPRAPKTDQSENDNELPMEETHDGPVQTLKKAVNLFCTKNMLLLSVTFCYTGLSLGFFSGVYGSCLGFTKSFADRKELVGLSGIFIGVGEVLGGATFGILGAKTNKWGRDPIVIGGFILHTVAYFLIFLNLPNSSPFGDTNEKAFITSIKAVALFCSFLLGLGDACYNTQIYSILGGVYSKNSAAAFAIFKFTQSVAAAICFGYASAVALYGQLGVLLVLAILGTVSFVMVEWTIKREASKRSSNTSINSQDSSNSQNDLES
ncbi:unnamed protein product [Brassicogethes aeneus]|uniref:UNC93-like protein MFSD11 n=1 Tax=Brassicogethes aeneus TaxID=1431903 RepID=A0A9P0AS11_BRAAE|nr:unnamed protein product [Brassicogethes aeneus]